MADAILVDFHNSGAPRKWELRSVALYTLLLSALSM